MKLMVFSDVFGCQWHEKVLPCKNSGKKIITFFSSSFQDFSLSFKKVLSHLRLLTKPVKITLSPSMMIWPVFVQFHTSIFLFYSFKKSVCFFVFNSKLSFQIKSLLFPSPSSALIDREEASLFWTFLRFVSIDFCVTLSWLILRRDKNTYFLKNVLFWKTCCRGWLDRKMTGNTMKAETRNQLLPNKLLDIQTTKTKHRHRCSKIYSEREWTRETFYW